MSAPETYPACEKHNARMEFFGYCGVDPENGVAGEDWRCAACEIERLRAELAEARKWCLAAALTGLYPSDTDISTPELWQTAQSEAACQLLSQRDAAQARVRELEAQNEINRKLALDVKERNDFYDELITLRAQIAQLRAALESVLSDLKARALLGHDGQPTLNISNSKLEELQAALASDGSELLAAIRDLLERADHVSRHLDHKGSSKQFLDRAIKNCAALANLNSAIGEVSHE